MGLSLIHALRLLLLLTLYLITPSTQLTSHFAVYRLTPHNDEQLNFLQNLYLNDTKLDFWKEPTKTGEQVHVMVDDSMRILLLEALEQRNMTSELMIDDVEKKIAKLKEKSEKMRRLSFLHDAPMSGGSNRISFNLARYHSFAEIINYLNALAVTYPDRVHVMPIGTTHEGRQIALIKIGRPARQKKPAIWIDGGIHAREWISPAVVLYMIDQLVVKYDTDPQMRNLVDNLDFYVVPLLNPDGYEYSRSSTHPEIRLWRKNRSPQTCKQTRAGPYSPVQMRCCQGVDLNRNFDWDFGVEGSSTNPCSEIYQGAYAFSEPETRSVRDFMNARRGQIRTFLTFHSYSQILMYPFGHQVRTYANDVRDLRNTAMHAANALQSMYGTKYVVGTGADTLYPASGGSEDWAKGRMGVKYSYLFELRPEEQVWDGFLLAENQIMPTSRETFEAVKVIAADTLSPTTVSSNVRRAPRIRNSPVTCTDHDRNCGYWAQQGVCATWADMKTQCPYSCGLCRSNRSFRG